MSIHKSTLSIPRTPISNQEHWELKNLNHINIFFGKNGSGKSVLMRNARNQNKTESHYIVPERAGEIKVQNNYLHEQLNESKRANRTNKNLALDYHQQVITRISSYMMARGGTRTEKIKLPPQKLEKHLNSLMPGFEFEITDNEVPYNLIREKGNSTINQIERLSSGEVQILSLGLDILTISAIWELKDQKQKIIFIDEPDTHLHPELQYRFARFLIKVIDEFDLQIFIATHSMSLMAALGTNEKEKTSVIYMDSNKTNYSAHSYSDGAERLSECLGGHVLMNSLVGAPILLVEGDDDYKIWSQVPRHHKIELAVIPCEGERQVRNHQKLLEKMFGSILDFKMPVAYALLDGDQNPPKPSEKIPQDFVRFIKLECRETENLFMTDEVLNDLGTDWETARNLIKDEAVKYGKKQEKLKNVDNWNRKTVNLKDVIEEVSLILDDKNVDWRKRVGQVIGRNKPSGQLADFIGEGVINELWT